MPKQRARLAILLTALLLVNVTACSDDDEILIPPEDPEREVTTTPDETVAQFQEFYEGRNVDFYADLLGSDFQFINQDGGSDDHAAEIAIAEKMFGEVEGDNRIIISDIAIDLLQPHSTWTQPPADDPHFGAFPESLYREYLVDFKFLVSGQNLILRVQGPVLIYVLNQGDGSPDFRILGFVDATYGNKATEASTWSDVRSLFD